uniref:Agouti signaling protein n=1 Tax=Magallana gigas TaxID=29159 RepID=A0A8W8ITR9_MAGGI
MVTLLEFSFLIYLHHLSTAAYHNLPSTSIEDEDEEENQPSTSASQPSINRPF